MEEKLLATFVGPKYGAQAQPLTKAVDRILEGDVKELSICAFHGDTFVRILDEDQAVEALAGVSMFEKQRIRDLLQKYGIRIHTVLGEMQG
ncbi:MAG: hypothetical protein WC806_05620 [Candidatus Gracilibacteria bacterium]|jgi:hypothetical protein